MFGAGGRLNGNTLNLLASRFFVSGIRVEVNDSSRPTQIRAQDLRDLQLARRLPGRNRTKADILVYRHAGGDVAVKDYSARPWWIRHTLGRWLLRREAAAYAAADGVPGLPRFLGRVGRFALATEWVDAQPLSTLTPDQVDTRCFDRVGGILDSLHARGVAVADLHHRDVLLGRRGEVWLVDLAAAWVSSDGAGSLRRRIFERLRDADAVALARMRARFSGRDPEAAVASVGPAAAAWHRRGRRVKRIVNALRGRNRLGQG